jgi:hypothetical protein
MYLMYVCISGMHVSNVCMCVSLVCMYLMYACVYVCISGMHVSNVCMCVSLVCMFLMYACVYVCVYLWYACI